MDQNTLDQLKKAFMAAPTNQLAVIICEALINDNNDEKLDDFNKQLTDTLSDSDLLIVANVLYKNNKFEQVLILLDQYKQTHFELYIKSMSQTGKQNEALKIYQDAINDGLVLKNSEIEQLLQLESTDSATEITSKKTKLKVVEKIDMADITSLSKYQEKVTDFSDVVGLNEIKKQISKKIIMPFQKPSLFQRFKKKVGGGVLLYGPPGCGKTLLARATAGECNAAFYNVEISDILDMYIGESEQKLHAIFEKARAETPCVLFFDEFEAMAGKRESNRSSSFNNIVSQFLTELDGFSQNNAGILVLASTNVPWSIDSAFLRPGRFDRMFFVPPPDKQARQGIIEHHMQDRPAKDDINYPALATKCKGYSGADLFNLVEMVADEAIDETIDTGHDVLINSNHFKQALNISNSTTIEWLTTARNYARYANDGGRYNDVLKFIQKHGK